MSEPPAAAKSETSIDDDFISEHFVTETISQRFNQFNQHNNEMLLESEDSDLLDRILVDCFDELLGDSSSLTESSIPVQSLIIGPRPLVFDDIASCSQFEEFSENCNSTIPLKNNQFSSYEESDFDKNYPFELIKNNRKDKKMLKFFVSERFQSNDPKSKKIKQKVESVINEHHDALINMVNNDLDICRMNLEQKMRKCKRLFQLFIKKLIDENHHIAYSEIEFTTMIDKKLLEDFEKLKSTVNKHLDQEKYSVRETFFKSLKASRTIIEKHFNFVDFLFLFTTLLENKIEIINNCVRNDMDQLTEVLRKEVRNFISNRVLFPNYERQTPFGNILVPSRATTGNYNETIFINNNFHDTRELLLAFESLPTIKATERNYLKSTNKQNKQLRRIFEELAVTTGGVGSETSENFDQEQDPDLKFLIHQIDLFNGSENSALTEPLRTDKTVAKVKPKRISGKNCVSTKNVRNAQRDDGHKKTYKKVLDQIESSLQAEMISERKIIKARRIQKSKVNTVDIIEAQVEPITLPEMVKVNNPTESNPTPNVQLLTLTPHENYLSLSANNSSPAPIDFKPNTTHHEHSFPGTSTSLSQSNNVPDENQLITEKQDLNNDFIVSFTKDANQDTSIDNKQTTEPESALYNSKIELQEYERHVVNDIIKDETIKKIVIQDIDKKLTEIDNCVADMYQKLVIANIEYQKLMRYKEEINRSQPSDTDNKTDNSRENHLEENM